MELNIQIAEQIPYYLVGALADIYRALNKYFRYLIVQDYYKLSSGSKDKILLQFLLETCTTFLCFLLQNYTCKIFLLSYSINYCMQCNTAGLKSHLFASCTGKSKR